MVTSKTERAFLLGRCRALANVFGVATLCALALPAQAATINFARGTVDVKIEVEGVSCKDESMLICITTPATQRAYLLTVAGDAKFVAEAYRVLLRRTVDPAGLAYYTDRLTAQTLTRGQLIDSIMSSPEYRALP